MTPYKGCIQWFFMKVISITKKKKNTHTYGSRCLLVKRHVKIKKKIFRKITLWYIINNLFVCAKTRKNKPEKTLTFIAPKRWYPSQKLDYDRSVCTVAIWYSSAIPTIYSEIITLNWRVIQFEFREDIQIKKFTHKLLIQIVQYGSYMP